MQSKRLIKELTEMRRDCKKYVPVNWDGYDIIDDTINHLSSPPLTKESKQEKDLIESTKDFAESNSLPWDEGIESMVLNAFRHGQYNPKVKDKKLKEAMFKSSSIVVLKSLGEEEIDTKTAEKVLMENVIGVNKEKLKSHFDFLPSVLKAMEQYANTKQISSEDIEGTNLKLILAELEDEIQHSEISGDKLTARLSLGSCKVLVKHLLSHFPTEQKEK